MDFLRKILRFIANYFVFVGGFLFVFTIGVLYAFIRPEGLFLNIFFLVLIVFWIIFLIKYFWEVMEKNKDSSKDL